MAVSRLDIQTSVDRLMLCPGYGYLLGLPANPGVTSDASTGVPTNGVAGFAPGAIFINYKSSGGSTHLYVNTGTVTSATWTALA